MYKVNGTLAKYTISQTANNTMNLKKMNTIYDNFKCDNRCKYSRNNVDKLLSTDDNTPKIPENKGHQVIMYMVLKKK